MSVDRAHEGSERGKDRTRPDAGAGAPAASSGWGRHRGPTGGRFSAPGAQLDGLGDQRTPPAKHVGPTRAAAIVGWLLFWGGEVGAKQSLLFLFYLERRRWTKHPESPTEEEGELFSDEPE